jgi:ABC-2 type transport system permease protein
MFDVKRINLIARREVVTRFKMKAYRWTLVIQILFATLAGLSPIAVSYFAGDTLGGDPVLVIDQADVNFAERMQANLVDDIPGVSALTVVAHDGDVESAREAVREGDASAAVIVMMSGDSLEYELIASDGGLLDVTSQRVQAGIYTTNIEIVAERAGVEPNQAQALVSAPAISVQDLGGERADPTENFSGPMFAIVNIGLVLTYIMFLMYGTWIAQGVVEEKSSRMMEIMVNAAPPRDLLVGKVIGVLIAGLVQLVPMLLAGGLAFSQQPRIAEMLDIDLIATFDFDMAAVSFQAITVFLVYFILGYFLFGALFAATGSMVSRQEEVNQAVGPITILIVVGLLVAYAVMALPNSMFAKVLFIVPLTSPFTALSRILLGDPSVGEIALSMGLLAISGVLAMMLAARVYRIGVLMYGQKPSFLNLFRLRNQQQVAR